VSPGKPEAAAVVWSPHGPRDDRAERARRARVVAVVRFVVAAAVGATAMYFDRPVLGAVALGAGTLVLVLGLASPLGAFAALDRTLTLAGHAVGVLLTWLLLAPLFYLVLAPFGLFTRRGAKDPMKRRLDPRAETYWKKRDAPNRFDRPY
jgi:hypothetical protein